MYALLPFSCSGTTEGSIVFTGWRQCAHPSNTLFLEPALVSPLNGISIGSAVFGEPTSGLRLDGSIVFTSMRHSAPLIRGSLGAHESVLQTASRSVG